MRYHNITHVDMLNGDGLRVVLWVAGCEHHCPECQNPITWDTDGGIPFDYPAQKELLDGVSKDYISGVTFSGGDPLHPENRESVGRLAEEIKRLWPHKTVWLYTGYQWESVKDLEMMRFVDVLVDGPYKKELRDTALHWVGSSNQRVINVTESLKQDTLVLK